MKSLTLSLQYDWKAVCEASGKQHFCSKRRRTPKALKELNGPGVYRWSSRDKRCVYVGEADELGKRIRLYERDTRSRGKLIQKSLKRELRAKKMSLDTLLVRSLKLEDREYGERVFNTQFGRRLIENLILFHCRATQARTLQLLNKALEDRKQKRRSPDKG